MKSLLSMILLVVAITSFSQVGIGTTTPNVNAVLDLTATNQALLLPRVANSSSITAPVNGMMIYAVNPKCFKAYVVPDWKDLTPCSPIPSAMTFGAVTYQGTSVINTIGIGYNGEAVPAASTITVQVTVTEPTTYSFVATHAATGLTYIATGSFPAAGTFPVVLNNNGVTIPGTTYGVLSMLLTGASNSVNLVPRIDVKSIPTNATELVPVTYGTQTWMDRNLGARRAATSVNDVLSYGSYFQWGRPADGHEITVTNGTTLVDGRGLYNATAVLSATTTPVHNNFILNSGGNGDWLATQADPDRWSISIQGPCPAGYRVPIEADWITLISFGAWVNRHNAYNSVLKFSSAGQCLRQAGILQNTGGFGLYWSNAPMGVWSRNMYFSDIAANTNFGQRAIGFSVRCIKI